MKTLLGKRYMRKSRRIRERGERSSAAFVAYLVTIVLIVISLIPMVWMVSSSFKDSHSIDTFPPKWIPDVPKTITITLDYGELEGKDRSFYELDAMKAMWYPWKKNQNESIGEMRVIGVSDNKIIYEAETPAYMFRAGMARIVPSLLFKDEVMTRKIPMIKERNYSEFNFYEDDGAEANPVSSEPLAEGTPAYKVNEFLNSTSYVGGTLTSINYKTDIWHIFDNYVALAVNKDAVGAGGYGFLHFLMNSTFVTGVTILSQLVIGGMAGYALSHLTSKKWSAWITLFFVATLMIPEVAILIPLYLTITDLHLTNTLWGIILPHTAYGAVIFLFKGFFDQLPGEMIQAARVDGASEFRIFGQMVVPMSIPIFTVVSVLVFLPMWNEFLWPLVVAREPKVWTFTVALNNFQDGIATNLLMASMIISTIPLLIVFISCQKYLEKGVSWTGTKG